MAASGIADSRDDALRYLASLSFGHIRPGFAEAFVDQGPRVFGWLESAAGLRMKIVSGYPDTRNDPAASPTAGGRWNLSCSRSGDSAAGRIGWCPATATRT